VVKYQKAKYKKEYFTALQRCALTKSTALQESPLIFLALNVRTPTTQDEESEE